ncbi:MAG: hypothetical protein D8M58_12820 [Calditrichaeota bacterium]|nr:MAG: hypothetical protein DWQ03_13605 [Calditrichota bacterium]MBL1206281.1 hypothetical protein [Calditrichota bacterium]NOG46107.1 alginate export family protein [Calditrichota bacterium]
MKRALLFSILLTSFLFSDLLAQDGTWVVNGQVRHRFNMMGQDFNGDTKTINNNELRTRIGVKFMPTEDVIGFIQLQDSRVMGTESSTLTDGSADALDAHQAYAQINKLFGMPLSMKVGRMEVALGNQRLIGAVGWHNIGRSFDGIQFTHAADNHSLHVFNFKTGEAGGFGDTSDVEVMGAWADFKVNEDLRVQGYGIWDRTVGPGMMSRITAGTQVDFKMGDLSATGEFAYQTGQISSTVDYAGMMYALNGTYNMNGTSFSAGLASLSGDDPTTTDKVESFNTLFATNHKFYGMMDYFLNVPVHSKGGGLLDIHVKASTKICEKTSIKGAFHMFSANEKVGGEDAIGNEIDLFLTHGYNKNVKFQGGFGYFMPGDFVKNVGINKYSGEDASTYLYLMTIINLN